MFLLVFKHTLILRISLYKCYHFCVCIKKWLHANISYIQSIIYLYYGTLDSLLTQCTGRLKLLFCLWPLNTNVTPSPHWLNRDYWGHFSSPTFFAHYSSLVTSLYHTCCKKFILCGDWIIYWLLFVHIHISYFTHLAPRSQI